MDDLDLLKARWATFAALILVFGFFFAITSVLNLFISAVVAVVMAALITAVLEYWLRLSLRRTSAGEQFTEFHRQLEEAQLQTLMALDLQRSFLQAHSEKEILEAVMKAGMDLLKMNGVSFVPYDEWGQSLPALQQGNVPGPALQSWAQCLIKPETRQVCKNCEVLHSDGGCVLLKAGNAFSGHVQCFPLKSSGREVGVINFYHDIEDAIDVDAYGFFNKMVISAGQALENLQRRYQEIAALYYLQTATTSKSDLSLLLNNLLENVQLALEVDFSMLYLPSGIPGQINPTSQVFSFIKTGEKSVDSIPNIQFLEGVWKSVLTSGQSISLENVLLNKVAKWKTLLAVPLVWRGGEPLGVLVLGSNSSHPFAQRQQALLETLAGQAALIIQNAGLMIQVEYQAVVDERTRLAREIHDGLAQTLAFLKIQATQMQNYLARGETEKLTDTLQANYRTLSDAYIDARQAIDNLRRAPSNNLRDWIGQVAADYEQATSQKINISAFEIDPEYPPNIQAQLIRIVQEALSNIRKHAMARTIDIVGRQDGDAILVEIRDDGLGFSPEGVDSKSRYGLRGMRERAESIGADFQITSLPGRGTIVSLRLPIAIEENI